MLKRQLPQLLQQQQPRRFSAVRLVNHQHAFGRFTKFASDAKERYNALLYPIDKFESFTDPRFQRQQYDGDAILASIMRDMQGWPREWALTPVQDKMHRASLMAEAALIYGKQYYLHRRDILERNNWKRMLAVLLLLTPRKFGKTVFLGQHATLLLMNIIGMQIACISKTYRQSILIISILKKVFRLHQRACEFVFKVCRATKLVASPRNDPTDEREIEAYPGNAEVRFFMFLNATPGGGGEGCYGSPDPALCQCTTPGVV